MTECSQWLCEELLTTSSLCR